MSESPPYIPRPFALRARFFCALVYLASFVAGCDGCGDPPIATLVEARGPEVQRDYADRMRQWEQAENGARFGVGDAIRTGANATARLTLIDQSQLELAPKTTLRFLVDGAQAGEDALNVESGQVSLRVGLEALLLRTHIGLAKLLAGTEVKLTRHGDNLEYEVALGEAQFQDASGTIRTLKPGESLEVGIGMAFLSKGSPTPEVDPVPEREPETPPGAILASVRTAGVRSRAGNGAWAKLPKGEHTLDPGTQIRLTRRDKVDVARGEERVALSGAGEYVVGVEAGLLQARKGELTVSAEQRDVTVVVPGGTIVLRGVEGGSEAKVSIGDAAGRVAVQRGAATVDLLGVVTELSAGNERRWTHTDEEGDSSAPILPSLDHRNLAARAGESFAVHAPEVPAAVGFEFPGKCPHEGVIELIGAKRRARGKDRLSMEVPPGAHAYTLRCIDDKGTLGRVIARANVQVLHDAGTRKLPPKAPTSLVETDGRTYTIYYQNQLPDVNVSWPNAPKSASYELILDGKPMRLSKPEHTFRSGSMRDGTHEVSFQAGDRRSRTTSIEVRFDNAAPKASLSSPPDRGFKPGDKVTIEGVALETWKVSVEGGSISMDAARRFSGEVATSAERPDIAVRLSHPRLGVHYYLRRAAGSP